MEKNRTTKLVVVAILFVTVLGLSLVFAAFSQNLKITPSASVDPKNNMYIYFTSADTKNGNEIIVDPVSASPTQYDINGGNQVEHFAIIDNTYASTQSPKITGLRADFTEPNQTVTYTFYVYNAWEYDVYLKNIIIDNTKECVAKEGTLSQDETTAAQQREKIANACDGISVSVKVGNDAAVKTTTSDISNHVLAYSGHNGATGFEPVVVTIEYAENSSVSDTDFNVTFGDITLNFSSQN